MLQQYKDYISASSNATLSFATSLKTAAANMVIMLAASFVIKGVSQIYDEIVNRQKNLNDKAAESVEAYESLKVELQDINQEIETTTLRIDELSNSPNLTFIEQEELQRLKDANEELERNLKLKNIEADSIAKDSHEDTLKALENKTTYTSNNGWENVNTTDTQYELEKMSLTTSSRGTILENAEKQLSDYYKYVTQKEALEKRLSEIQKEDPEYYMRNTDYNNMQAASDKLDGWIGDAKAKLDETNEIFNKHKKALNPDEDQELIYSINNFQDKYIAEFTTTAQTATQIFDDIWNSKDFNSTKKKLVDLSIAGNLKPEVLESNDEYKELLVATGKSADEVAQHINKIIKLEYELADIKPPEPITKSGAMTTVNELSDGFESLNKIISSINDKDNPFNYSLLDDKIFKESFQGLDTAYTNFIETLSSSPKDIAACQDAFNNLVTEYLNQNEITGVLDENTKSLIVSMLDNMGVSNAEAIVTDLLIQKQAALAAERYYNTNAADNLKDGTLAEYIAFLDEADAAEVSRYALAQLVLSKIAVNGTKIETSSDIDQVINLANAAGASATVLAKLAQAKAIYSKAETQGLNGSAGDLKMLEEADKLMADISNGTIDWEFKIDPNKFKSAEYSNNKPKNSTVSPSNSLSEQPKEFNWLKTRDEYLQKEHDNIKKILDDETQSYEKQLDAIENLIAKDKERLEASNQALKTYEDQWTKVSAKLSQEDIDNIQFGNDFIGEHTGQYAEDLQEAADIYKEKKSYEEDVANITEEQNEHLRDQVKIHGEIIKAQQDEVKSQMDLLQSKMDLIESQGGVVTERMIQKQISLSEDLMSSYHDEIDNLYEQLGNVDPNSAAYSSLLSDINDCESAIIDCQIQQQEWNEKIMRLPIERIQKYLNMLANIKQDLQNFLDEQSAMGIHPTADQLQQLFDISKEEIRSLLEQQETLKGLLEQYRYGSEKFNDVSQEIQDIDNNISGLIQSQKEWNASILQIPVDQMGKLGDTLSLVSGTLDSILGDYDTALSAVTGVIDRQAESLEDLKSAAEGDYQSKIDPLQEELDLLQKQNDERQTQLDLEQKQYDLDRARNQKTNKVIRDGEMVYEADADAVRNASQGLADAEYNKLIENLGNQISDLEEERDKLLESYDTQIEKLNEIKDKWSSIVDEIQLAANTSKANDLLGEGWQDKILSGNDDEIYTLFQGLYENTSSQKTQLEEQTASNERIAEMMNQFVTRYQEGSISYEQAMAGIRELSAQMKDGYSSLEQLNALLGLSGVDQIETLLQNMQASAKTSVDQFSDYMIIVKANSDAMTQYTSSWEEMQQNIKDQIAALQKLAEEAAKIAEGVRKYDSSNRNEGSGSSGGPSVNDNHYVASGPGHTEEALAEAIAGGKEILEYHAGGLVGAKDAPSRYIGLLSSKNLSDNEVYGKLLKNEWVMTEEQQKIFDSNIQSILSVNHAPNLHLSSWLSNISEKAPDITINMGDTILEHVSKPDEFARALATQFKPLLRQEMSKL